MKTVSALLGFVLALVVFSQAQAGETAYSRTCRVSGGLAWAVSQQTEFDTPLCRFGKAAIGAAAFAEYKWNGTQSDAVTVYMNQNQSSDPGSVCSENGGSDVSATDSNGRTWALCAFSDGSVIETNTLARGTASAANSALNRALKN